MEDLGKNLPSRIEPEKVESVGQNLEISESNPIYFIRLDKENHKAYFADSNKWYWTYDLLRKTFVQEKQIVDMEVPKEYNPELNAGFRKFTSAEDAMIYGARIHLQNEFEFFKQSSDDKYLQDWAQKRAGVVSKRYENLIKIIDELLEEKGPEKREELKKQYEEGYKNLTAI